MYIKLFLSKSFKINQDLFLILFKYFKLEKVLNKFIGVNMHSLMRMNEEKFIVFLKTLIYSILYYFSWLSIYSLLFHILIQFIRNCYNNIFFITYNIS